MQAPASKSAASGSVIAFVDGTQQKLAQVPNALPSVAS
jgi:hypothetical protein